jgi:LPXTG-motif cell wall-anchored protein
MPPPPDPAVDLPLLVLVIIPTNAAPDSAPTEVASAELPHTGSQLPLIGILGLLALTAGLGLRAARLLV